MVKNFNQKYTPRQDRLGSLNRAELKEFFSVVKSIEDAFLKAREKEIHNVDFPWDFSEKLSKNPAKELRKVYDCLDDLHQVYMYTFEVGIELQQPDLSNSDLMDYLSYTTIYQDNGKIKVCFSCETEAWFFASLSGFSDKKGLIKFNPEICKSFNSYPKLIGDDRVLKAEAIQDIACISRCQDHQIWLDKSDGKYFLRTGLFQGENDPNWVRIRMESSDE